jgi:hypothetical protein
MITHPGPIEGVEGWSRHLEANTQGLRPFVARWSTFLARSSSAMIATHSATAFLFEWRAHESYRPRRGETGAFAMAPIRLRPSQNGVRGSKGRSKIRGGSGGSEESLRRGILISASAALQRRNSAPHGARRGRQGTRNQNAAPMKEHHCREKPRWYPSSSSLSMTIRRAFYLVQAERHAIAQALAMFRSA